MNEEIERPHRFTVRLSEAENMEIRQQASRLQVDVSTYLRLLIQAAKQGEISWKKREKREKGEK